MTTIDGPLMYTCMGRYVSPIYPWDWEPDIREIAHALSAINRFTGHTNAPYSVAQHSVHVADLLPPELQLAGLLHDSPEAYLGDWASFLKHHPLIGQGYRSVESAMAHRFEEFFGCNFDHDLVHHADRQMLAAEKRDLFPEDGAEWLVLRGVRPRVERVVPWSPRLARRVFAARFESLTAKAAA